LIYSPLIIFYQTLLIAFQEQRRFDKVVLSKLKILLIELNNELLFLLKFSNHLIFTPIDVKQKKD